MTPPALAAAVLKQFLHNTASQCSMKVRQNNFFPKTTSSHFYNSATFYVLNSHNLKNAFKCAAKKAVIIRDYGSNNLQPLVSNIGIYQKCIRSSYCVSAPQPIEQFCI